MQSYMCCAFLHGFRVVRESQPKRCSHAAKLENLPVVQQSQLIELLHTTRHKLNIR